jgi:uncharacterized protein YecE (DUF72 family)
VDEEAIRLHGPDRDGIEEETGGDWSKVVEPRDEDLDRLAIMVRDLKAGRRNVWLFVNNHFEGCAPMTIRRFWERMAG